MSDEVNGTAAPAPLKTEVTVSGRVYDLAKAFPLTLGDFERLEELGVITEGNIKLNPKGITNMLHTLISKLDPTVERAAVSAIPMGELPAVGEILQMMAKRETDSVKSPT